MDLLTIQCLPHHLMTEVVDERKYDGVKESLSYKGCAWGQGEKNAGRQNEEEDSGKERHHRVKHGMGIF